MLSIIVDLNISSVVCYCFSNELDSYVKDCIDCYTHDWFVVEYCYRHHSTSSTVRDRLTEREILLQNIPRQEFELDLNERALSDDELHLRAVSNICIKLYK